MKMKTVYSAATLVLLLVAVWLFFIRPFNIDNHNTDSVTAVDEGTYQKVVLTLKNGNYYPSIITLEAGKPVRVYLDDSVAGCYRSFTIRSFGVNKYIDSADDYVEFTPTKPGNYGFACSMGMGKGTFIVE